MTSWILQDCISTLAATGTSGLKILTAAASTRAPLKATAHACSLLGGGAQQAATSLSVRQHRSRRALRHRQQATRTNPNGSAAARRRRLVVMHYIRADSTSRISRAAGRCKCRPRSAYEVPKNPRKSICVVVALQVVQRLFLK